MPMIDGVTISEANIRYRSITDPLMSLSINLLNRRSKDPKANSNLAYLKFLVMDVVTVVDRVANNSLLLNKALDMVAEYGPITNLQIYEDKLQELYSKDNLNRLRRIGGKYDPPSITGFIEALKVCLNVNTQKDRQSYLYVTYSFAQHNPTCWTNIDISSYAEEFSEAMRHVLTIGNYPDAQLVQRTIAYQMIYFLRDVLVKHGLSDEDILNVFHGSVIFVMTMLHLYHVKRLCEAYVTSDYGSHFMTYAEQLHQCIQKFIEWKLPSCRQPD